MVKTVQKMDKTKQINKYINQELVFKLQSQYNWSFRFENKKINKMNRVNLVP